MKDVLLGREQEVLDAVAVHGVVKAAKLLGVHRSSVTRLMTRLRSGTQAPVDTGFSLSEIERSERGLNGYDPVIPGFAIKQISSQDGDAWIKQTRAPGEVFQLPQGQAIKGVSALVDPNGRELVKWIKTDREAGASIATMRAAFEGFKGELPREPAVQMPTGCSSHLLNQFTVTDLHFGMLSWRDETGADYDLGIAEKLLMDWFTIAIELAPRAHTAVLAQLGDLLHHDGHDSVTPTHRHVLDADSRLQKVIRVVIRTMRRIIRMLLAKHEHVHVIMADANHDPASGAWLRETFATFYEDEPRITVDTSPKSYYSYEWGDTSLFYHHGHKRKIASVDSVFAGSFRELYGRTKHSYAHIGHLHSDEWRKTNLMKVERHETLAAPDAYAANGGWLSGRSAKVITYGRRGGEFSRVILTAQAVEDMMQERIAA